MSTGPSFDGTNADAVITTSIVQSTNFVATNTTNQFSTTATDMEFRAVASQPVYKFETSSGAVTGEIQAAKVTLSQPSTITTSTGTSLTLQNDTTTPTLVISKTTNSGEKGLGASITTISTDQAALSLANNQASSALVLQATAPNVPAGQKASILIGKDNSNTGNSFTIGSKYIGAGNSTLEINSFGESTPALQVNKQATTSTSATTGSVIVPGDLTSTTKVSSKALVLYGSSSGSATINPPAVIATPYSLTLPNAMGTVGQVLTLDTPSGSTASTSWQTVSIPSPTTGVICREPTPSTTNFSNSYMVWDSIITTQSTGTVPLSYSGGTFTNTSGTTAAFYVVVNIGVYISPAGLTQAYIRRTSSSADYIGGYYNTIFSTDATFTLSGIVVLAPNDGFSVALINSSGTTSRQYIGNQASNTVRASKITISQVIYNAVSGGGGGSGITSLTLSSPSSLFSISGSPTSGTTPTLSINTANTPTGFGPIVCQTNPLINGTADIANISSGGTITSYTSRTSRFSVAEELVTYTASNQAMSCTGTKTNIRVAATSFLNVWLNIPSALLFDVGTIFTIYNENLYGLTLRKADGMAFIANVGYKSQISLRLISNSTSNGVWHASIGLDSSAAKCTPTNFDLVSGTPLGLYNTSDSNVNVLIDSSTFTPYNFVLPTSAGTVGQVLTSSGGSTLTWTSIASASTLSLTSVGNTIISTSATGTTLTVSGRAVPMQIENTYTATGTLTCLRVLAPNLGVASNAQSQIFHGVATTTGMSIIEAFRNVGGTANTALNYYTWSMFGSNPSIEMSYPLKDSYDTSGTFRVNGGLVADNIHVGQDVYINTSGQMTFFGSSSKLLTYYGGNQFGSNVVTVVHDTTPILKVYGQMGTANSLVPALEINSVSSQTETVATASYNSSLTTNNKITHLIGQNTNTYNASKISYVHDGNASLYNRLELSLIGDTKAMEILRAGQTATSGFATCQVYGGLRVSKNIYTNESITATTSITSASISTNSLTINGSNYTPTSGTVFDTELRWGYYTSNPTVTLSYPYNLPREDGTSGTITNRRYSWQKIGLTYSFSLDFYCDITYTSAQLHLCFLYTTSHFPPVPASASYTTEITANGGSTESYYSTLAFGNGTYIPCT